MNIFDFLFITIFFISLIFSFKRGFVREFLGFLGWILALIISFSSYKIINFYISKLIYIGTISEIISWTIPFSFFVIFWYRIASEISPFLVELIFKNFNNFFGLLFGIFKGILFLFIFHILILLKYEKTDDIPININESMIIKKISKFSKIITPKVLKYLPTNENLKNENRNLMKFKKDEKF